MEAGEISRKRNNNNRRRMMNKAFRWWDGGRIFASHVARAVLLLVLSIWRLDSKNKRSVAAAIVLLLLLFFFALLVIAFNFPGHSWNLYISIVSGDSSQRSRPTSSRDPGSLQYPLQCPNSNLPLACPRNYPTRHDPANPGRPSSSSSSSSSLSSCPEYFRWIHEDLRPWKETGITREMVERARKTAHFRVVIVSGNVYVEKYRPAIQSRDVFTLWGILQLIRLYPGRLPDLDIMFDCDDVPVVRSRDFVGPTANPPPLFRYCADEWSLDIVFPDWSFWGWAETNIRPWSSTWKGIKEGNKKRRWEERVPYAYWRGNPHVAATRRDLLRCNVSEKADWSTHLYIQNWDQESRQGFKQSNLEDQCTHRYKIYIEGWAWSVSEKYIMACDSMTLLIRPRYYDFFMRGMLPLHHYWPIQNTHKCTSLKFAVHWGNSHTQKAQAIGKAGSSFIEEDLKMDYVYDYMFHLLNEYTKLLKFKPAVPPGAVEFCSETMACTANGTWKSFMLESMVMAPSHTAPCTMHPPYHPSALQDFLEKKANSTRQVEMWENEYWENLNKDHN